jgi:hypothetical protein
MDFQTIAVLLIVLAAMLYAGSQIWRKVKSFAPKTSSCASDCGCSSAAKAAKTLVKN